MLGEIETLYFLVFSDAQTDGEVDEFEDHERSNDCQDPRNDHAHTLIEQLAGVSLEQAGGERVSLRVFEDGIDCGRGEYARQKSAQGSPGAMNAKGVEVSS